MKPGFWSFALFTAGLLAGCGPTPLRVIAVAPPGRVRPARDPQGVSAPRQRGVVTGKLVYSPDGSTLADIQGVEQGPFGITSGIALRRAGDGHILRQLPAPATTLYWLAFLPDGRLLAAGDGGQGRPGLWQLQGDGFAAVPLPQPGSGNDGVALGADGRTLAIATDQGLVLDDLMTNTPRPLPAVKTSSIYMMALSPDGHTIAVTNGGPFTLYDRQTGRLLHQITGVASSQEAMKFSPDGRQLVYTLNNGGDGILRTDVATGNTLPPLTGHIGVVPDIVFTADGARLISCGWDDKAVRVWDAHTGKLLRVLAGPKPRITRDMDPLTGRVRSETISPAHPLTSLAVSPDGKTLAGSDGENVMFWDLNSGRGLGKVATTVLAPGPFLSAALSPDGRRLYSGHLNGILAGWDLASAAQQGATSVGASPVGAVACSPDGHTVAVICRGDIQVWDSSLTRQTAALHVGDSVQSSLVYAPDGRSLAVASENGVRVWEVGSPSPQHTLTAGTRAVTSLAYAPDGTAVASGDTGGALRVWSPRSGKLRWQDVTRARGIDAVAYSPNGALLASGGEDGQVRLQHAATGAPAGDTLSFAPVTDRRTGRVLPAEVLSVGFSPDGSDIAAATGDGRLTIWDVPTRRVRRSVHLPVGAPVRLEYAPDGLTLVITSAQGIQILDLKTGELKSVFTSPQY